MKIWFLSAVLLLSGCTSMDGRVLHTFEFGGYGDNRDVQVLDYRYGTIFVPNTSRVLAGKVGQDLGYTGRFPIQEEAFFKWRVIATGKEYAQTVKIRSNLKTIRDDFRVRFVIREDILDVYIISHLPHPPNERDCELTSYREARCERIFSAKASSGTP